MKKEGEIINRRGQERMEEEDYMNKGGERKEQKGPDMKGRNERK